MSGTFEISGDNIIINFKYEALAATVISIVGDAAEYLFDHSGEGDEIIFDDLSNQDKLDLVDAHVRGVIVALANTFKSMKAQEAAREIEAESEYEL